MKKITFILFIAIAATWLYGCKTKPVNTGCDNSINNWDHFITKADAKLYIDSLKARQALHPGLHALDTSIVAVAQLFGHARDMMRNMMLRDSCVGIRIYYGLKKNSIIPIVCGVTASGNDIYWKKEFGSLTKGIETEGLLDNSEPEPPVMVTRSLFFP